MKKARILVLLLAIGLWLIHSCDFDINEVSFQEVEIPEPEHPQVWLNFNDSILVIYDNCTFQYAVQLESQTLVRTELYIDEDLVHSNTDSVGSYTTHIRDGNHTLDMLIYTSSASGSIRETLGGEITVFSKSWQLVKEKPESYKGIKFLRSGIEDGIFKAHWETYEDYRFNSYRMRTGNYGYYLKVEDVNQTSVTDPYYIGGDITYYLDVMTTDNEELACDTISFSSLNELSYSMDKDLNLTLSWNKCPFSSVFHSYSMVNFLNGNLIEYQSMDINDTSFTFPYGLFPKLTFEMTTKGKVLDGGGANYTFGTEVRIGENIDSYEGISRNMFPPYRVYSDQQVFDPVKNTVSSYEKPVPFDLIQISPDNKILTSATHWQDPDQPGIWNELKDLPEEFVTTRSKRISLSANQLGIFESDDSFLIYDFAGDSVVVPWNKGGLELREFSPNGEYYLGTNHEGINICTQLGSDWRSTSTLKDYGFASYMDICPYLFLPNMEQSDFVFLAENKLVLWSCDRNELIAEAPCPARIMLDLDPQSSTLLCGDRAAKLFVYSLPDLVLLKEIDISGDLEAKQNYSRSNLAFSCGRLYMQDRSFNAYEFILDE